jgi:hypoxanthine phosphoribosyltransferase
MITGNVLFSSMIENGDNDMKEKIGVLISREEVESRIDEMAEELDRIYAGKQVHLIGILKGSVFFLCELAKRMKVPVTMDFMSVSSYGDGTSSSGIVKLNKDLDESIEGKNVVIVEDILDSGRTLSYLVSILKSRKPADIKVITLLDKPERRVVPVELYMTGFQVPDRFVVGYGLDCAQKYRNLPYIGVIEQ